MASVPHHFRTGRAAGRHAHNRTAVVLLVLSAVVVLLTLGGLPARASGAEAATSGLTVTKTVHADSAWIDAGRLEVFRLSSTPEADDGAIVVTWALDRSTWFPTWNLLLTSETGLLPPSGFKIGPVSPVEGFAYDLALSVHPETGTIALVVYSLAEGRTLRQQMWQVEPMAAPLVPVGDAGTVTGSYLPVAATWDLTVPLESGSYVAVSLINRTEEVAVRTALGAVAEGEVYLLVDGGGERREVLLGPAAYEMALYPLDVSRLPLGPLTLALQYRVAGEPVWVSPPRQVTVGRVEAAVRQAEPRAEAAVLEVTLELAGDGPLAGLDLRLDAVVSALEWDRSTLSFAETVRSSHRYHLLAGPGAEDGLARVRIPVESEPALWRVELSLASEPAISTQLGNNRILFGPRTQETILTSGAPVPIAASPLAPTRDWESELALIEERYAQFDSDEGAILFIGSSSIRGWRTLQTDFPGLPVLNAGFGGSQIIDAVYFFDRLVRPVAPHTIVMYSGSNDIAAGKSPEQVFADYVAFVDAVHAAFPKTRILYISIAPSPARWSQRFNVQRANRLIELYTQTDDRLEFIDVYTHMLGEDGLPRPELYISDQLHMTPVGYALWTDIVRPYLYGEPPAAR